ncbi:MAG: hypothetical protein P8M34_05525 [Saprospiraceae bacterium]|nr:hypothetical protein [Saprospiraceae bacterium]|tara:strand:+ start:718 stop:867 length:150 start_codon:yes stop_codon:yes gene_type:complete
MAPPEWIPLFSEQMLSVIIGKAATTFRFGHVAAFSYAPISHDASRRKFL